MSNERAYLMTISKFLANKRLHNPSFMSIHNKEGGKSELALIISQDPHVKIIEPVTEHAVKAWIDEYAITKMLIWDGISGWEYKNLIKTCAVWKKLQDLEIRNPEVNKFHQGLGTQAMIATWCDCNPDEWDDIYPIHRKTGIFDREITMLTTHSEKTEVEITKEYMLNNYSKENLPKLAMEEPKEREYDELLRKDLEWVGEYFPKGFRNKTVRLIAMYSTHERFEQLKPFLTSHMNRKVAIEKVEFQKNIKWVKGKTMKAEYEIIGDQ